MYSGWNLLLTLVLALICGHSNAFIWPFSVFAAADTQEHVYADANAKRIAIIGTFVSNYQI
jgi:prenylcysteine oxidase/farnesylcysteine lyase